MIVVARHLEPDRTAADPAVTVVADPEALALRAFRATALGLVVTDDRGRILLVNPAFSSITGYELGEVKGKNPRLLQSGRHGADFYRRMWHVLRVLGQWSGEIWNRRKSGEFFPEWLTINAIEDERGKVLNYVGVFSDISRRKMIERRLARLAYSDPLTGLPNRTLFLDRFSQALAHARRNYWSLAVLMIDLDDFKRINDIYGHPTGDAVLRSVSERFTRNIRDYDTAARAGGDEFMLLLPHIEREEEAATVAAKILAALDDGFSIEGCRIELRASIGISVFPRDGSDAGDLLRKADVAMYSAKQAGKHAACRYRETDETSDSDSPNGRAHLRRPRTAQRGSGADKRQARRPEPS